ncbi:MAG: hypothetical protein OEL76_06735 [Siculibacillus sp.]|nr:hypothetical protein [Siculibacillus sp.]
MRAGILSRGFMAAAVVSFLAAPGLAGEGPEDALRTLYRIALSADMCGFPMQKRQADVLGKAMDKALVESGLDEDKAEALYRSVDTGLEAEGWDKVCAQKGEWARDYRAILAARTQ